MPTTYLASATRTIRFLGRCDHCIRPIGVENAEHFADIMYLPCPDCGTRSKLERLYGTVEEMRCDSRCESAIGPVCVCACGGANHGGRYFQVGEALISAIAEYRATTQRRRVAAQRRADTRRANRVAAEAEAQSRYELDNAEFLRNIAAYTGNNGFLNSIRTQAAQGRQLSDRQLEAGARVLTQEVERQARFEAQRAQEQASGIPVPVGRYSVEGVVTKVIEPDRYDEFPTWKMNLKCEGFSVRVTIPAEILDRVNRRGNELIGRKVGLTATWKQHSQNAFFGFGKRPTNAYIVDESQGSSLD